MHIVQALSALGVGGSELVVAELTVGRRGKAAPPPAFQTTGPELPDQRVSARQLASLLKVLHPEMIAYPVGSAMRTGLASVSSALSAKPVSAS